MSIAITAAVVGVFVVVAAHLTFHGWPGSIPDQVHHFGGNAPVVLAPDPSPRLLAAGAAGGTGAAQPGGAPAGSPAGSGDVTLSSGSSRPSGRGADHPALTGGAAASSAGHAHHAQPPAASAPAAPSVTTDAGGIVDGSVGRIKQKSGNGVGRAEPAAPTESAAAPTVKDTDAPSTNPVPTSPAPGGAETRGAPSTKLAE